MKRTRWTALLGALALVLAACGGGGEEATTTAGADTTAPADNPIQVLFVPSVSADEIVDEVTRQTREMAADDSKKSGGSR